LICPSALSLGTHFKTDHPADIPNGPTDDLVALCEAPMYHFAEDACPFCVKWTTSIGSASANRKRFRSHLGNHLQQIAQEAIPLSIEGLEIIEDEESEEDYDYSTASDDSGDSQDPGVLEEAASHVNLGVGTDSEQPSGDSQPPSTAEQVSTHSTSQEHSRAQETGRPTDRGSTADKVSGSNEDEFPSVPIVNLGKDVSWEYPDREEPLNFSYTIRSGFDHVATMDGSRPAEDGHGEQNSP
jgi:hypothetical protein